MKKNYRIIVVVVLISAALWSFIPKQKTDSIEKDKVLLELLLFVIEKGHYNPVVIDDSFSKGVYKDYVIALDPSKRFLLQSDINEFSKYEYQIDDQLKSQDLSFFTFTYDRLMERMAESKDIYKSILETPFDYTINEDFDTDYEKASYVKTKKELEDRWRKQLKLSVLSSITDKIKLEEDKKKADSTRQYVPKLFADIEKESRESTLKSLNDYFIFIDDLNREDWFTVYINSIAGRVDPHTSYFAPEDKERFDVSMSGKLEGIGAKLQKKNDFTEITELISGGPAWRGKNLEVGDMIMKVAQGKEEPVDVIGMRLDDVVKKIKGAKGTEVRLTVKKVDGTIKVVSIIRDIVELEETYAKSSIVNKGGKLYGIIYLPKFYIDFEDKNNRDAAKDVSIEIDRLKVQGVEGIVMDLRDNGGGSLKTVVDITGLFINQGPVVQVKSAEKMKEVLSNSDSKVHWDGPLVVLVNNFSASASEIFTAAIQDYKRGIVIGSKQTYGKGTVQNVMDLNRFVRGNALGDLGALKITTQKFYRINGGSTQLKGVASDVVMPDRYSYIDIGERDLDNAMQWDKIDPANYKLWDKQLNNLSLVIANSKVRIDESEQFKMIDENARWISKRRKDNLYNLNYQKFKVSLEKKEAEAKKYKSISDYKNKLVFNSLPYEVELMKNDSVFKQKRERWHESLAKDVYVEESLNILSDLLTKSLTKVVTHHSKVVKDKFVTSKEE